MKSLKSLWNKIEEKAILSVLFLFFALQIVAEFIPRVDSFMSRRGSLVLIALALFLIFRYMSEKLDPKLNKNLEHIGTFTQGVIDFLKHDPNYQTVDIMAHNGFMYYMAIKDSKVKIKSLRLLLRGGDNLDAMQFPSNESSKSDYKQQLNQMIFSWKQLKVDGQVGKISIRIYPFDPVAYFMITNSRNLHFGFLRPKHIHPGTEVMNSFTMSDASPEGKQLTNDLKLLFDTIWRDFGKDIK